MTMKMRNLASIALGLFLIVSPMATGPTMATPLNVCGGDTSQICAPISALHYTTNGVASSISNGQASVNLASTIFQFTFAGTSTVSGKYLSVHFFDINGPMHVLMTIGDSAQGTGCAASGASGKSCVLQANAQGNASFEVKVLNPEIGDSFSYQTIGPAGFASGVVNILYTATGANTNPADTCNADRSKVCPDISRATITVGDRSVAKTFNAQGAGASTLQTGTTVTEILYTSDSSYAYKWAFMKFLNASSGVTVALDAGDPTTSRACDAQDAIQGGCRIKLDAQGSARFIATFAGGAVGKTVQYEFSGPSFDSKVVTIGFAAAAAFTPVVVPAIVVKVSVAKHLITVTVTNAKAESVTIQLDKLTAITLIPTDKSVVYHFPVSAGKHTVVTTVKKIKKTSKVTVT